MGTKVEISGHASEQQTLEIIPQSDAAALLGVTRRTLQNWYAARKGPASVKVGSKVFYRHTSLVAWVKSQERPAGGALPTRGRACCLRFHLNWN
jgi:hypothetical protein